MLYKTCMPDNSQSWTFWGLLIVLLLGFSTFAHATVEVVNYTHEEDVFLEEATINALYNGNVFFRGMYELLDESSRNYRFVFVGADVQPDLVPKTREGVIQRGAFAAERRVLMTFGPNEIAKNPNFVYQNAINQLTYENNAIIVYVSAFETPEGLVHPLMFPTLLQETFHALQHEYYANLDRASIFNDLTKTAAIEVESELSNHVFMLPDKHSHIRNQMFKEVQGFRLLIDYFISLASGDFEPEERLKAQMDRTANDIWDIMKDYLGYSCKQECPNIVLEDFETLTWFMENQLFH